MANLPTQNNNPGDLKDPATGTFRTFDDPGKGYAALANDLQYKIDNHPNWSLGDFANVYAPPSDNNDTAQYTANLANQLGVAPNAPISSLQPKMGQFVQAIAHNEGFNGAQAVKPQPEQTQQTQTQSSGSDTSWLDGILGLNLPKGLFNGGPLAAAGAALTLPWLLGPGAGAAVDTAELAGGGAGLGMLATAGAGAAAPSILSKVGSWLSPALEGAAAGEVIDKGMSAISGGSQPSQQVSAPQSAPQFTPPPTNQSVSQPYQPQITQSPQQLEQQLPQAAQASQRATQAISEAVSATPTGTVMMHDPAYQQGATALGHYGILPNVDENGKNDSSAALEKADELISRMSKSNSDVFAAEGRTGNAGDIISDAQKEVDDNKTLSPQEQEEAKKLIASEVGSYAKRDGDQEGNMPLQHIERMKKNVGPAAKFGLTDPNSKKVAYRAINRAAKRNILKNTYHKEFYSKMLEQEKHLINGKELLEKIDGKKAPINHSVIKDLLHAGGRYAALYIGDKIGGPVGAVLGDMVGSKIIRAVDKRHGKTIFETKGMKKAMEILQHESPAVYKHIQNQLQNIHLHNKSVQERLKRSGLGNAEEAIRIAQVSAKAKKPEKTESRGMYEYFRHLKEPQPKK